MCPISYSTMTSSKNHRFDLRNHMVKMAMSDGVRATARAFKTTRNTVRKWLRRFNDVGATGLTDLNRAPKSCPHKTSAEVESKVIEQRKKTPGFGARRLKYEFELPCSKNAIARIIRQNNLIHRRKRKHQTKRDLRDVKAQYKALTRFQTDVKYLNDIPHYWPFMTDLHLPRFQYTTRCVKTGATFLAYGSEISVTYAELTVRKILEHLIAFGIDPKTVTFQTDRGSEFDGQAVHKNDRGFTYTIEQVFGAHHQLLLRYNPNANADVESFHYHEEPEFFDIESFSGMPDFWRKITTYQNYWNIGRVNFYKGAKTPLQILREFAPEISPSVLLLPPINLDNLMSSSQVGHDLPSPAALDVFLGMTRYIMTHP